MRSSLVPKRFTRGPAPKILRASSSLWSSITIAIFDDYCMLAAKLIIIKMRSQFFAALLVATLCLTTAANAYTFRRFTNTYILIDQILM